MKRRKSKAVDGPVNGNPSVADVTASMFADSRKLSDLRTACGHLKRVAKPGPVHLQKFIERVFAIAGVGGEEDQPAEDAAQS